jgi:GNAT superfamily N-acetyltransferase
MSFGFNLAFAALSKPQYGEYEGFLSADAEDYLMDEGVGVLGAFNDDTDELIAAAVFTEEENAKLLSIAVADEYRRQGVGSALLSHMAKMLKKAGAKGMECLLSGSPEESGAGSGTGMFFRKCGFTPAGSYSDFSLSISSAGQEPQLDSLIKEGPEEGCEKAPHPGTQEAELLMDFLPIEPEEGVLDYSPSFSTVYRKNGKIIGCFLVSEEGDAFLVNMFHLMSRNFGMLQNMAVRSLMAISGSCGEAAELRFMAVTDKAEEVYNKLFPAESAAGRLTRYVLSFDQEERNG